MTGKDLRRGGLARLTVEDIVTPGFSTPWDAPTIPPFPFTFRNVEVLTLAWRTSEAAVARVLPPPLEPTSDVVLAHVYRMNDVDWLGAYGESNVSVGCRLPGADIAGSYSPYLFLSSDVGVAHGREVHGQPKKLGEPLLEIRGDLTVGIVRRNGIDVLTGTMATKQRPDSLDSTDAALRFRPQHQFEGGRPHRWPSSDPATDRASTGGRQRARMLGWTVHRRIAPERSGPHSSPSGRRHARRPLLARRLHACPGAR